MYTKNAFKNLKNRYKAVLKKCNLLNIFGSLALASAFFMSAIMPNSAYASTFQETDAYRIEEAVSGTSYYNTFDVQAYDATTGTTSTTTYGILLKTPTGTTSTMKGLLEACIENLESAVQTGNDNFYEYIDVVDSDGTFSFKYTDENGIEQTLSFNVYGEDGNIITKAGTQITDLSVFLTSNHIGLEYDADGGVLYNIGSGARGLAGNFIGNSVKGENISGGAIYNDGSGTIMYITGSFIGNHADGSVTANGGAIFSSKLIGNMAGYLIGNYASSSGGNAFGGAIYNSATISRLVGSFIGNYASGKTGAYGGAIYGNEGTMDKIEGSFIGNYASSSAGNAYGGAIYHYEGYINTISGSFIGNSASGITAYGGAIYNEGGNFTFLADNETHLFTDNYTLSGTTKDYNFIASEGGELTFTMTGTGGFILNDSIVNANSIAYALTISGVDKTTNVFSLNDEISGFSSLTVSNATLSLGSYNHGDSSGGATTVASFSGETDSTIEFTNANLSIDTLAFNGITSGTAVLGGNNTTTLTVDTDSTLSLANASVNTYTIAENFVSDSTVWNANNVTVTNALLEDIEVSGDAVNSAYTVTVGVKEHSDTDTDTDTGSGKENSIYNTPSAGLLFALANSEFYVPDSTNAGARFVYNIMENTTTSDAQKIQIVEGAVQMGAVAGVQRELATAINSANTVLVTRMLNVNSVNPTSTAMRVVDENGHVSVYNNVTMLASNDYNVLATPKDYTEIWIMPMYAHENIRGISSGNFSSTGYQSDMYGVALGIDRTFQDKYRVGLAFDMGSGRSESEGDYASTENDYNFFGVMAYGSLRLDKFSFFGSAGYTKNNSEVTQNLSAYSLNNLYADIQGDVWNFTLKAEYNYAFGEGFNLAPYVGVEYMIMTTDDYKVQESNSTGNGGYGNTVFNVNSDRQEVFSFPLGVALSKEYHTESGWDFTSTVNVGVIFATGDLYATSVSSIPGIDGTSSMSLQVIDNTTLDLGLKLSASKNNFTMMLDYDFQSSEHRTAHGLTAKLMYKF